MFPDLEKGNITGGAVGLLVPESVTDVDRRGTCWRIYNKNLIQGDIRESPSRAHHRVQDSGGRGDRVCGVPGVLLQPRHRPRIWGRGCR